ncbi:MAG: 1-aminocyclopropane-1-carboxylate deaminase/D-cysteine desulfhydrase [Vicinamibacterales bacterium]
MTPGTSAARRALAALPSLKLWTGPSPVHELARLRHHIGGGPRLLIKRDDLIGFGFGGNKVRKMALVAARALEERADTLITTGGLQSNHARTTAVVAATLGLECHLVLSGDPPPSATGNLRLAELSGAHVHYVAGRTDRAPAVGALAQRLADEGRRPFVIPLGASTPLGALGYAQAFEELLTQIDPPDVIVHSTSSAGTQAGLLAGCEMVGAATKIIGVSADDPADVIARRVAALLQDMDGVLGLAGDSAAPADAIHVDDRFVGSGYAVPTDASTEATHLAARCEGVFLDPTYTAKAMAALLALVRTGTWEASRTVLFWHTGGLPGLLA